MASVCCGHLVTWEDGQLRHGGAVQLLAWCWKTMRLWGVESRCICMICDPACSFRVGQGSVACLDIRAVVARIHTNVQYLKNFLSFCWSSVLCGFPIGKANELVLHRLFFRVGLKGQPGNKREWIITFKDI